MKNAFIWSAICLLWLITDFAGAQNPEYALNNQVSGKSIASGSSISKDKVVSPSVAATSAAGTVSPKSPNIIVITSSDGSEVTIDFKEELTLATLVGLSDISGKTVSAEKLRANTHTHSVNLSALENGLYLLKIRNADYCVIRRLSVAQ